MERPQEQPSSTDELAYGRPAETDERGRQAAGTDPAPPAGSEPTGHSTAPPPPQPADTHAQPGTAPGGGAAPREEREGAYGGAPAGAEGAGAPAAEAPPRAEPAPPAAAPPATDQHAGSAPGTGTGAGHDQAAAGHSENGAVPLLSHGDSEGFERRWQDIQVGFVDEPARCVEQADTLVADVMKRLAEGFAEERRSLEGQWGRGDDVSTEDLRVALQRYRSFFNRLLSTSG